MGRETPAATDDAFTSDPTDLAAASEFTSESATAPLDRTAKPHARGFYPRLDTSAHPPAPADG